MGIAEDVEELNAFRSAKLDKRTKRIRILTLDIETFPAKVFTWGMWKQNHHIEHIIEEGGVLCFAAKWLGDREVEFYSLRQDGRAGMLAAAHRLLSEADIVVTYNGDGFDIPRLNQEFMLQGWPPPAPFKSVDLIRTNRKRFDLPSRKLEYLATRSGVGSKVKHAGFRLWVACLDGDEAAWRTMERYNIGDVRLTERVYLRLIPWITEQPHLGLLSGGEKVCPHCGSAAIDPVHKRIHAFVQTYTLYRCSNCGGWARDQFKLQQPIRTRSVK